MSGLVSGVTRDTGKLKLDEKGGNDHERCDLCKYVIKNIRNVIFHMTLKNRKFDRLQEWNRLDWALDYIKGMVSFVLKII